MINIIHKIMKISLYIILVFYTQMIREIIKDWLLKNGKNVK